MVEQVTNGRNVIDFLGYKKVRDADSAADAAGVSDKIVFRPDAPKTAGNFCRHCGAAMMDGETDDDCSTAGITSPASRMFCAE
jgi:hypothetical protein